MDKILYSLDFLQWHYFVTKGLDLRLRMQTSFDYDKLFDYFIKQNYSIYDKSFLILMFNEHLDSHKMYSIKNIP